MALQAKGKALVQALIDDGKLFRSGSLRAVARVDGYGRLPEPHRSRLDMLARFSGLEAVLYSFETPIAWRAKGGTWEVPPVHYSPTTTDHQRVARTAKAAPGFYS